MPNITDRDTPREGERRAYGGALGAGAVVVAASLSDLVREVLHGQQDRVGGGLAETTDRGIDHRLAKLGQEALVPRVGLHQLDGFFAADPAGGALPAAFILEEAQHVERGIPRPVLIRQHPDGGSPDEGPVRLQGVEVQGHIIH